MTSLNRKPLAKVLKNHHNGVKVTHDDIKSTLDFIGHDKQGLITAESLNHSLSRIFPSISHRECELLMAGNTSISIHELSRILTENTLLNYDPSVDGKLINLTFRYSCCLLFMLVHCSL